MKLNRIASLIAIAGLFLASLTTAQTARADATAVAMLQQYVNNARNQVHGPGSYGLTVTVTEANSNIGWSSYVDVVTLPFENGHWIFSKLLAFYVPTNYHGNGTQYFSDRRFAFLPNQFAFYPFNPHAVDSLGIRINAENGSATWTLNSWGGGTFTSDLHAFNGILLGAVGTTSIMISVRESYQPIIH